MRPFVLFVGVAVAGCAPTTGVADDPSMPEVMTTNAAQGITSSNPVDYASKLEQGTRGVCDFRAYSNAPKGLDVRAHPSSTAKKLGRLPKHKYDRELESYHGPDFQVLEARNGWFRINYQQGNRSLIGWVPGHNLGFDLQTDIAHAEPTVKSLVVATSWEEGGYTHLHWREPSDCKGLWVAVRVRNSDSLEHLGWANGICANQDTACDGAWGEELPRR